MGALHSRSAEGATGTYTDMRTAAESPNIRITARSKATLRDLAEREGNPMQAVLAAAIEYYQLDEVSAAYARWRIAGLQTAL